MFLPSVIKSLVQVSLLKSNDQNEMIHYVPANCNRITSTRTLFLRSLLRMEFSSKILPSVKNYLYK